MAVGGGPNTAVATLGCTVAAASSGGNRLNLVGPFGVAGWVVGVGAAKSTGGATASGAGGGRAAPSTALLPTVVARPSALWWCLRRSTLSLEPRPGGSRSAGPRPAPGAAALPPDRSTAWLTRCTSAPRGGSSRFWTIAAQ